MITEIGQDLFCLKVPLPNSPLKDLNIYILKSNERNLIIDTGFNNHQCQQAIKAAQRKLNIDWQQTDLFITHFHADHFGLVSHLASKDTRIFFNRFDTEWFFSWEGFDCHARYVIGHGFPSRKIPSVRKAYGEIGEPAQWLKDIHVVEDGDQLNIGRFNLKCIHTPGHSRGHMCLYEPNHKFLFSGDHILADISPIIMCFSDHENPLKAYLNSLEKTRNLDVNLVLPGHRSSMDDHCKAIDTIRQHHETRLEETLNILSESPKSAYEIAAKMKWNSPEENWNRFAELQKWFAVSEAIAHIRFLEEAGMVTRYINRYSIIFHLTN